MISLLPAPPSLLPNDEPSRLTLAEARARVLQLDPEMGPDSASFETALILVAAARIGQNIDRIARFTGITREQVARRARRLVDNGVWCDGATVSRWAQGAGDVEAFRSDVGVAEGRLCRRIDESGEMEWAPHGYWRKHYDYVPPRDGPQPQVVCYHPHVEVPVQDLPYLPATADEGEPEEAPQVERTAPPVMADPVSADLWLGGEEELVLAEATGWDPGADSTAEELFPDAVWLA